MAASTYCNGRHLPAIIVSRVSLRPLAEGRRNTLAAPDPLQKVLAYRWLVFGVLAVGYVLVNFHRLCPAVVAVDMMADLRAGGTLVGLLGSAYFYPYAAMQLPAGVLADSWGPRRTITVFFLIACVGSLVLGWAPSVGVAVAGRVLVGLGVSMLFVPTMKILAEWFRHDEFGAMAGWMLAVAGVGSLSATAPLAWLSGWVGWRNAFLVVGAVTLATAGLVWWVVRDRPADLGWPSVAEHAAGPATPEPRVRDTFRTVLGTRGFWPLALWFFCITGVFFAFGGLWAGPYLAHVHGLDRSAVGGLLALLSVGIMAGAPALAFLSNRVFRARKPVLVLSSAVTVALAALLAFLPGSLPVWGVGGICLGIGVFGSGVVAVGFTANKELFPTRIAGTATGLVNLFPFAGGAVMQPLVGRVIESHGRVGEAFTLAGYAAGFQVLFVSAVLALLASMFVRETWGEKPKG